MSAMSASDRQRQRDRELVLLGMAIGSRQVASQVRADWLETADE